MEYTTATNDPQTRAQTAEADAAKLLAHYAHVLVAAQQDAQSVEDRDELRALLRAGSAVRVIVEAPRRGAGLPLTVAITVLDGTGGERDVRLIRLAPADPEARN
jgi:hypothetical protein